MWRTEPKASYMQEKLSVNQISGPAFLKGRCADTQMTSKIFNGFMEQPMRKQNNPMKKYQSRTIVKGSQNFNLYSMGSDWMKVDLLSADTMQHDNEQ